MKEYILVFGGCSWDCTHKQKEDGSYSEKPDLETPGGKGANQAVAAARAGVDVKIITIVGDDEEGYKIITNLQNNSVDTSHAKMLKGIKSDCSHIYVSREGDNDIKRTRQAIDKFEKDLIEENAEIIKGAKFVVTQSKMDKEILVKLIEFCSQKGVKTVLTPCPTKGLEIKDEENKRLLKKVTIITANESEAKQLTCASSIEYAVKMLPNMIVTAGEKGVYFMQDGEVVNIAACSPRKLVDTTGAGDTFCGNLIARLCKGESKENAIRYGIKASTIKLEKLGAQAGMPYAKEVEVFSENE